MENSTSEVHKNVKEPRSWPNVTQKEGANEDGRQGSHLLILKPEPGLDDHKGKEDENKTKDYEGELKYSYPLEKSEFDAKTEDDTEKSYGNANWLPSSPEESSVDELGNNESEKHCLQCLSKFFTDPEKLAIEVPDAVITIKGNYFVVLPNEFHEGETLFRAIGQAVLDQEQKHYEVRDKVVDFIVSPEGWHHLGSHIIPFYETFIDEMKHAKKYYIRGGGHKKEEYFRRVYRHYLVNKAIEGSLIELIGASLFYNFHYTCFFLQEEEEGEGRLPLGKASFRVIHSFDEKIEDEGKQQGHHYFLRIGESPEEWVWSLLLPYSFANQNLEDDESLTWNSKIPRGIYQGELWNVHGLTWNVHKEKSPFNFFKWMKGVTVIATSSGKFLGGYTSLDQDLFSNLCWLLHGNFGHYNTVRNTISRKRFPRLSFMGHPSQIILTEEEATKSKAVSEHLLTCNALTSVGTLDDLHKASKVFKFGYFVIGINENGELHTVSKNTYRKVGRPVLHFLVRTRRGVITRWCALQDMLTSDEWRVPSKSFNSAPILNTEEPTTSTGEFNLNRKKRSATKIISRCITRIQSFITRINSRNKIDTHSDQ